MTPGIKPFVCGNWKMNGLTAQSAHLATMEALYDEQLQGKVELGICPPFTLVASMSQVSTSIAIGAQDCHANESGAHTGDISAPMLADVGAKYVICGHSERRADHQESDADIRVKVEAIAAAGLIPIACVGETREERDAGRAIEVVTSQLDGSLPDQVQDDLVIAYEPVWAIGTGLVPSVEDVTEMHTAIRAHLTARYNEQASGFRLLYGGSVKPGNAGELMAIEHVDGALVGGASLKPDDFLGIAEAYRNMG
jgi:triosephosphate isomerase